MPSAKILTGLPMTPVELEGGVVWLAQIDYAMDSTIESKAFSTLAKAQAWLVSELNYDDWAALADDEHYLNNEDHIYFEILEKTIDEQE